MRRDCLDGLRHFVGNAPCMHQKIASCGRWLRPSPYALDEPNAKLLFKQPNVEADGGLCQPNLLGRRGETTEIRDIDEALQLSEVEIHIKETLMLCIRSIIFILICLWCRLQRPAYPFRTFRNDLRHKNRHDHPPLRRGGYPCDR